MCVECAFVCVCVFSCRVLIMKLNFSSCSQNVMKLKTYFHPDKLKENPASQEFVEVSLALGLKATTKKTATTMTFFVL